MNRLEELFKQIEREKSVGGPITHLVIGLGNPGKEYEETRHNAGFRFIDRLASEYGISVTRARFQALTGEGTVGDARVLLVKPQTFMNASGEAIREAAAFYKIPIEHIIVISDDISLEPGRLRVRKSGSDGGQRGIRSAIKCLGGDAFPRIRIGVGAKPRPDYDLADWVLGVPDSASRQKMAATYPAARDGLLCLLKGDIDAAMQAANGFRAE